MERNSASRQEGDRPAPGTDVLDRQFLFIIGSPRSGTSWLQTMLGAHPDVCTSVELTLFNRYLAPWLEAWRSEAAAIREGRWHQGLPILWTEAEFRGFLRDFLRRTYERVLQTKPNATHILDKHPGYAFHTATIRAFFPTARFLHVIRDGRDVVASMLAARRDMGFGGETAAACAIEWRDSILAARRAAAEEKSYLEVRYEQLLADPVGSLRTVLEFCGLRCDPDLAARIVEDNRFERMKAARKSPVAGIQEPAGHFRKGRAGSWREELSPGQLAEVLRVAGSLLAELGYLPVEQASPEAVVARPRSWLRLLARSLGRFRLADSRGK